MTSNLVTVNNNGQVVVSSRDVAENFGKLHKDVLENIREILKAENSALTFFYETTYKVEGNNKSYPEYLMNRNGFTLLAMGFTGSKALEWRLKYIQAFNDMEEQCSKPTGVQGYLEMTEEDRAIAYFTTAKEKKQALLQLEEAKPAVAFMERYVAIKNTSSIREVAKIIGIPEQSFITLMIDNNILYRLGTTLVPYSKYQHYGKYFEVKTGENNGYGFHQTRFTTDGIRWISNVAKKKGWVS